MGISEILIGLLSEKNIRQADLSRITGIPTSLISNYINGIKSPTLTNSVKLAEALGVSIDKLAGIDTKKSPPSEDEDDIKKQLIENYDSMNDAGQHELLKMSRLLSNSTEYKKCDQFSLDKDTA